MKSVSSKIIITAAGIIVILILFSLAQEMNRRLQIQKEVVALEQEVQGMEKKIVEMAQLNQYFRTDAFQERMAREKLNYRASGEEVVLIPEENFDDAKTAEATGELKKTAIPIKWWQAFFDNS